MIILVVVSVLLLVSLSMFLLWGVYLLLLDQIDEMNIGGSMTNIERR